MNLLLDTHTFLWFIGDNPKLSSTARVLIEDVTNRVYLSVASLWEMEIKISLGKPRLAQPFEILLPQQLNLNHIDLLEITVEHAAAVATLPFHHRDPFDRLLIAQAKSETVPIVGSDAAFDAYPITRLW